MKLNRYLRDSSPLYTNPQGTDAGIFNYPFYAGIELEIEGVHNDMPDVNPQNWSIINDSSLRNGGLELITAGPKGGTDLSNCLEDLEESLANLDIQISERCSTHIHIDVSDMTIPQILNYVLLASMFETILFRLFGSERTSNTFCMSTKDGGNNFINLCSLSEKPDLNRIMDVRWSKYNAVSLNRLRDLGTVEFRMFSPILDKSKYQRVLYFLFAMKNEAMSISGISDIITYKKAHSLQDLFAKVFPDEPYDEEFHNDIDKGVQLVNDVIIHREVFKLTESRRIELRNELATIERGI